MNAHVGDDSSFLSQTCLSIVRRQQQITSGADLLSQLCFLAEMVTDRIIGEK